MIQYIPEEYVTEEMKYKAVDNSYFNLTYIKNPSKEVCLRAIDNSAYAMKHIPSDMINSEEFCMQAIKINPMVLEHIKNQTIDMILLAVSIEPHVLKHVEIGDYDEEIIAFHCVLVNPNILNCISNKKLKEMGKSVLEQLGVEYTPKNNNMTTVTYHNGYNVYRNNKTYKWNMDDDYYI